ncbi:MAG: FAD-dependent oxidoreductase [Acidobacteria bacterium]|nr:FAD-dependent oxidoreductase [Acidobacteriota bacterium]
MTIPVRFPDVDHWKAQVKCQSACPVNTDAGRYVQLIAEGRDEDAFLVARAPNPFASICGRVCAAPCEDACRRGAIDGAVAIRTLKRFVTEKYGAESTRPDTQDRLRDAPIAEGNRYVNQAPLKLFRSAGEATAKGSRRKVAIVGAGPAGLSAAHDLALLGYDVTVFEAAAEPGGMVRFGIPEYRLPRTLIRAEIDKILGLGVQLKLNTPLSSDFGLSQLKALGFAAIFLAVGVSKGRDLDVPGVELDGVVKAVDYLLNVNRGYRMDLGRRIVVIGGGFVAFDAARTAMRADGSTVDAGATAAAEARVKEALDSARAAIRGGARDVTVVSLENFDEMPVLRTTQGHEEFEEARKEGVTFVTRRGAARFVGSGRLQTIALRRVTSVFDANGRFAPQYDDSDLVTLEADSCILAIGKKPDLSFLTPADGVALTPGGTIRIDADTLSTSVPGVFAGGDVAFGPRNLIEAVANGKRAARSIHRYLIGQAGPKGPALHDPAGSKGPALQIDIEHMPSRAYRMIAGFEALDRQAAPTLDVGRRTGIAEVETGYDEREARLQAARCLVCHIQTIYDPEKCVICNRCVDVCPEYCLAFVPLDQLDLDADTRASLVARAEGDGLPLAAMVKDDDRCIRCGLCAIRCPTDAMTMERFTITEQP